MLIWLKNMNIYQFYLYLYKFIKKEVSNNILSLHSMFIFPLLYASYIIVYAKYLFRPYQSYIY